MRSVLRCPLVIAVGGNFNEALTPCGGCFALQSGGGVNSNRLYSMATALVPGVRMLVKNWSLTAAQWALIVSPVMPFPAFFTMWFASRYRYFSPASQLAVR